jgi:hypothetical protein
MKCSKEQAFYFSKKMSIVIFLIFSYDTFGAKPLGFSHHIHPKPFSITPAVTSR